ncbi:MAG: HEAT repeat domain-containing protein [Gemmatimonadetes bacterium]|nr:HEAT repeat domain-containing protein [Gemmatimonadota bacterium]
MDRHVEFATQLSILVALYARDPVDHGAEKAALRAARGAAKHGAVELLMVGGKLRAGRHEIESEGAALEAVQTLLAGLGVERLGVAHHAKQEQIKRLAKLLGAVAQGNTSPEQFVAALGAGDWDEITVERAAAAGAERVPQAPSEVEPVPAVEATTGSTERTADADAPVATAESAEPTPESEPLAPVEPPSDVPTRPLAEQLPDAAQRLSPEHRQIFERLITSSEPLTLRRLLEPLQTVIEQTQRDGQVTDSVRLVLAMFACEACAEDSEMRRQFVVTLRRLTKPTLLRAYAMTYLEAEDRRAEIEQVLARFGEDGAEAAADCAGSASNGEERALYLDLLRRLPGTNDALVAMLDDERASMVERAISLLAELGHPDMDRLFGEQLGDERPRVRQAAARALTALKDSPFAADALARAAHDTSPEVRLVAAVGLQARREERLVTAVLPLVDTEDELDVQLALVATLGRIVTSEGVQKLIALANPSERMLRRRRAPVLRLHAIEALGEARTPAAMAALQKLLEDKEQSVREAAARLYTRARRQTAAMGVQAVSDT